MGYWDIAPWDNDEAADWFGSLMQKTRLARHVEETLTLDVMNNSAEIRAAAFIVRVLGKCYIWPIEDLDRHRALAADRLQAIIDEGVYEQDEFNDAIRNEIAELRTPL